MPFTRYRDVVPDWAGFQEALGTPEPVTLRVRTGQVSADRLIPRLEGQGFQLSAVTGASGFWRVDEGPGSVAQTLEHWLGLFHVQQAVMGLPTLALAPRAGERVLDLCAAPGGKTAHIAELMGDRGPLVAVDPKEKRLRGLLGNLYRLGHPNVLVIAADGRQLPGGAMFDRILVDAPCSAEGTSRRQGGRVPRRDAGFVAYVTSVQEALLRRAVDLLLPGGVLVYSTCTFAPEENEAVVSRVLSDTPLEVEPIPLEAPHSPGLADWGGTSFNPSLVRAWRVYPHQMNSGGLFMVRLRKATGSNEPDAGWSPVPQAFPGGDTAAAALRITAAQLELEHRFGMPHHILESLCWMVRGENIWAHTAERWPVATWSRDPAATRWRVVSLGIRALKQRPEGMETPSNHFLARWGKALGTDRQVELTRDQLRILLSDLHIPSAGLPVGPVALLWEGMVLGRGMVGVGGLRHEIPGASAARLSTLLGVRTSSGSQRSSDVKADPATGGKEWK